MSETTNQSQAVGLRRISDRLASVESKLTMSIDRADGLAGRVAALEVLHDELQEKYAEPKDPDAPIFQPMLEPVAVVRTPEIEACMATARAIADEMIADSIENDRRREETAGYNLYAQIHIEKSEWTEAIASAEQVLAVAQEIGDDGLGAGAHARLARCWLELGDTDKAAVHLQFVLNQRPADAEILRLQARLAAATGDHRSAVTLMSEARTRAGESWSSEDDERLAMWQQAADAASDEP